MAELTGKTILVGVSGGIAAYKMPNLVSMLVQNGADVHVLLTENAKNIIPPLPFEALTGNRCLTSPFERSDPPVIHHIALAKKADLLFLAPASADIIGKCANGIADDMLTSTILACQCPIYFAPAMNDGCIPIRSCRKICRSSGGMDGTRLTRLSDTWPAAAQDWGKCPTRKSCTCIFSGNWPAKKTCRAETAGDSRRNPGSHRPGPVYHQPFLRQDGLCDCKAAMLRGADVTLVSGRTALTPSPFVHRVDVVSAADMYREVTARAPEQDIIIKAAAVADYTPAEVADEKIKKKDGDLSIPLIRTQDILGYLGAHRVPARCSAAFRWKRSICWKTPAKSWKRKMST